MKIGQKIKQIRLERGWSQEQLAEGLFTAQTTVSSWEQGVNEPNLETIQRIANCLHVSPYTLMPFDKEKTDDDRQQEIMDSFYRSSPKRKLLFDRTRHFSDKDLDALLAVCDAIARRGDADE